MKKLTYFILIIACLPLLAKNNDASSFAITGVTGKVLANVTKRLNELQQLKPLNELTKEELRYQIIKAIQPFGYFKADVSVQISNNHDLSVRIHPGPPMYISSLKAEIIGEGSQNPLLLKTLREIPLKVGAPLLTDQYNQTKQSLINSAENLGYLHGSFKKAEILIEENKNTAQIILIFDSGPLYFFGQVQFDPSYINPELLHRFVPFHYGQPYSTDQVLHFNNYLSGSGYFNSVLVTPQITDAPTVPVRIHLEPVPKYSYSLGVGYGTDTGVRGRAGLHIIPVNRRGHKFNALAQGSMVQNALQAQYVVPGKNPITDQYSLTGNFSNLNYNTGYSNSVLVSLAQQHHLEQFQRSISINSLYESFHYYLQPNTDQFMIYPKVTFTFSKTQSALFSPSGYNITLNGLGANQATLSQIDFAQVSMDAKAALMIEPMRLRLYAHALQGFTATDNINQLPLSLALLLGGTDNLKAYTFNSIGPGKLISYGGVEVQKETFKNWYLLGFYDAGSVYNPSPKNILYDVGLGLMWVSPIGPIKAGLAQAVDNRFGRTSSSPRLVINIGPDL